MAGEDKSGMMVNIMKGSLETIKEMDSVDLYIRTEKSKKDNGSKTNLRDSETNDYKKKLYDRNIL